MAEGRHRPAPPRRLPPAVVIVPAAIVALGAIAFFVFRGGGAAGVFNNGPDDTIPSFDFTTAKIAAISVAKELKQPPAAAKQAAAAVTSTLADLYTRAFLDPANWRNGAYDDLWGMFDDRSRAAAQQQASTLTLGNGGSTLSKVDQPKGKITVKVLLNNQDQAATAVAIVSFGAVGTRDDGKLLVIRSTGQYFLRREGDHWVVYSFSVNRDDAVRLPPPGPSGATPSGGAS